MTSRHEADSVEHRKLKSVARKYRRDGYSVTFPDRTTDIPSFLGDYLPDLIAISDDDRVVVEIRRAAAIPGSNDLVDLAERVERDPRWRFELIALAADPARPISPEIVDETQSDVQALLEARFYTAAFIRAFATTEGLVASIAIRNKMNTDGPSFRRLVRNLVTEGLISGDHFSAITKALQTRNRLVNWGGSEKADRAEIDDLLHLNKALMDELLADVAA